jgi:hypothetical protein
MPSQANAGLAARRCNLIAQSSSGVQQFFRPAPLGVRAPHSDIKKVAKRQWGALHWGRQMPAAEFGYAVISIAACVV